MIITWHCNKLSKKDIIKLLADQCDNSLRCEYCQHNVIGGNIIYTVQEIWGDGDSYPSLIGLNLFLKKEKAIEYCHATFKEKDNKPEKCFIVFEDENKIEEYTDIRYGDFSGFLIVENEVL